MHRDILCKALLEHYLDDSQVHRGLLVLLPRESLKTTFTHGAFALFILLRGKHLHQRDERIQLIHHKDVMAQRNLVDLKAKLVQHPWIKEVWPEFSAPEDFGTKAAFTVPCKSLQGPKEDSVIAMGMGASFTGSHCDWQLYSDAVNEDHVDSKTVRDEAEQKYTLTRYMLNSRRGKEVMDGTRYHPNDLYGKNIKANVDGTAIYKVVCHAAIADDDALLYPTHLTRDFLEKRRQEEISRRGNDDFWWLQYQNRATSSRMIAANWDWVRHCSQSEIPPGAMRCIFVDPAWKGTDNSGEGDSASIQAWAFERRGSLTFYYLLDGFHSNDITDAEGRAFIFQLMKRYGVVSVAPEEHGGKAFKRSLSAEANTRGAYIEVLDLKSQNVNKGQRITTFLGQAQAGRVFVCKEANADLIEAFKDQFRDFPQVDHDDALDCAAYSCDPVVAERVVPYWNAFAEPWWNRKREEQEPKRTRYCAL